MRSSPTPNSPKTRTKTKTTYPPLTPEGEQAFSIFIQAPSVDVLRERLIGRGTDSDEAIERRVAKAASEMEFAAGKFDHVLINDDLQKALEEAELITTEFLNR